MSVLVPSRGVKLSGFGRFVPALSRFLHAQASATASWRLELTEKTGLRKALKLWVIRSHQLHTIGRSWYYAGPHGCRCPGPL